MRLPEFVALTLILTGCAPALAKTPTRLPPTQMPQPTETPTSTPTTTPSRTPTILPSPTLRVLSTIEQAEAWGFTVQKVGIDPQCSLAIPPRDQQPRVDGFDETFMLWGDALYRAKPNCIFVVKHNYEITVTADTTQTIFTWVEPANQNNPSETYTIDIHANNSVSLSKTPNEK